LETVPKLERKIGLFSATNIVIANMVGAGIFTTSGLLMADLHNPMLMLALWLLGGIIALAGAFCYGEIGASLPLAGGEYAFLSKLYHPMLGFLSGWVSFLVGFSAPIAASALGLSEYLFRALPGLFEWDMVSVGVVKKLVAVLVIGVFTGIHLRGVSIGATVQNFLTVLKIIILIAFVGLGILIGNGNWNHLWEGQPVAYQFGSLKTMALSLMWIMFAYSGWNASTYIGSEIINPLKNIPRSLILGTGSVMLLYLLVNLVLVYGIAPEAMEGVISIGGLAMHNLFGIQAEQLFSLMISLALFSSISAFIILGPRVYYAMAQDGHFFRFAATIHQTTKVPVYSILFQGAIAIVIILSGTLDQIFTYMGFSLSIFPLLVVFSLFKIRNASESALRLPGYPITPLLYLAAGVSILILAFLERPIESSIAIGTVLIGIPAYFVFKIRSASGKP
jgi:basic amino acid/polyamine antiporter, APA family